MAHRDEASGENAPNHADGSAIDGGAPRHGVDSPPRIGRSAAAKILGVGLSTVRRAEGRSLTPYVVDGVHWFDEVEVRRLASSGTLRARALPRERQRDEVTAIEVFEDFGDGIEAVDVVRQRKLHPDVVEKMRAQYMRLSYAVAVPDAALQDLASAFAIALDRAPPFTAADLLRALRDLLRIASRKCIECGERRGSVCDPCVDLRERHAREMAEPLFPAARRT